MIRVLTWSERENLYELLSCAGEEGMETPPPVGRTMLCFRLLKWHWHMPALPPQRGAMPACRRCLPLEVALCERAGEIFDATGLFMLCAVLDTPVHQR